MPEGPELHLNSNFVNKVSKGRLFCGKVVKSAVSKCQEVDFSSPSFTISSESRGKEIALFLQCQKDRDKTVRLLFRFGMSGQFKFEPVDQKHKHAHLSFFAQGEPKMVLSFVDARRFGSWRVSDGWGEDRGADPMWEYAVFRKHILDNFMKDSVFAKPICEVMLNQKYFNGVGNYLRAEILYRAGIPPFISARDAVERNVNSSKSSGQSPDFLQLCHNVPLEVVKLNATRYMNEGQGEGEGELTFSKWLQCYTVPTMRNLVDHNGRTIWFSGDPGPLAPKNGKTRFKSASSDDKKPPKRLKRKQKKSTVKVEYEDPTSLEASDLQFPKKREVKKEILLAPLSKRSKSINQTANHVTVRRSARLATIKSRIE